MEDLGFGSFIVFPILPLPRQAACGGTSRRFLAAWSRGFDAARNSRRKESQLSAWMVGLWIMYGWARTENQFPTRIAIGMSEMSKRKNKSTRRFLASGFTP